MICGKTAVDHTCSHLAVYHSLVESPDDFLRRFWEMEDALKSDQPYYTREEREVIKHFDDNHTRTDEGRFIVPLPRKAGAKPLGKSSSSQIQESRVRLTPKGKIPRSQQGYDGVHQPGSSRANS